MSRKKEIELTCQDCGKKLHLEINENEESPYPDNVCICEKCWDENGYEEQL